MSAPIRAIYEDGKLHPLAPLDLSEGQEVRIVISASKDPMVAALGNLVAEHAPVELTEIDEAAIQQEIDDACQDIPPASEAIVGERRNGLSSLC